MGWVYDKHGGGWRTDQFTPLYDELWRLVLGKDNPQKPPEPPKPDPVSPVEQVTWVEPVPSPAPPAELSGASEPVEMTIPEEPALTAGEQDHSYAWVFAGEDADAPVDVGRPADG